MWQNKWTQIWHQQVLYSNSPGHLSWEKELQKSDYIPKQLSSNSLEKMAPFPMD